MVTGFQRRGKVRERILRVLLNNPEGTLTKYRVAKLAEGSFPWVHEYAKQLESAHLIEGTRVLDYRGLVERWASIRTPPRKVDYALQDPERFLMKTILDYAATTYRAETLLQGYLFPSRTDVYVRPGDEGAWGVALAGKALKGKGNLRLLVDDEHVFYDAREVKGLKLVSTPQLIVDLLIEGGVCVEAAEMLLGKAVGEAVPVG